VPATSHHGLNMDLVHRFAETVPLRSDHVAAEGPEGSLRYGELDRLTNQLAARLRRLGVCEDVRVGVSVPRGLTELAVLLAVAKAGGAYVPLDPSHPEDRLRLILEDARPVVLIVGSGSKLAAGIDAQVITVDGLHSLAPGESEEPLDLTYRPTSLAYVLFTSGSTGRPKGVEITRGAFSNFLRSMAHTPGFAPHERLVAITTTSFDIAGLELFLPLWMGGTVVIVDRQTSLDPRRLRRVLDRGDFDVMQATPAMWRLLLDAGWTPQRKLRMLCGGEALHADLATRLLASGGALWNLYGPTETTVWSTLCRIESGENITIGHPIDNTQIYILGEDGQVITDGREGEICIGGDGLARGYLGRPDLTQERFIAHPGGAGRIYRTGDLGRFRPDGALECLGRLDHQVKIRGFRVELGEIEAILRAVPNVVEVVVHPDRSVPHDPRLVAYWVGAATREDLIAAARRGLPGYLVPAAYCQLEVFPLNTNGKIDRKQLPQVVQREAPTAAPPADRGESSTEALIAKIWRRLLQLPSVGLDDDFFTVGGTSMLALEVVRILEQETGIEVPLQAFFENPTIAGIADQMGLTLPPDAPIVVTLRDAQDASEAPLWCLLGIRLYRELAQSYQGRSAVFGIHVPVRFIPGKDPRPTVESIAREYLREIRRRQPKGPYRLLGLCFGGVVAYEVAVRLEDAGERVEIVAILDAILPEGERVDPWLRARMAMRDLGRDPGGALGRISQRVRTFVAPEAPKQAKPKPLHPVELSVVDPETDADVARYAARRRPIASPVLIVRAAADPHPPWKRHEPHLGWAGASPKVVAHEIAAGHLEILKRPHVGSLAQAVEDVLGSAPTPHLAPR